LVGEGRKVSEEREEFAYDDRRVDREKKNCRVGYFFFNRNGVGGDGEKKVTEGREETPSSPKKRPWAIIRRNSVYPLTEKKTTIREEEATFFAGKEPA